MRKKPTFYEGGRTSPFQVPIKKLEKTKGVPMARDRGKRRKRIWSVYRFAKLESRMIGASDLRRFQALLGQSGCDI